MYRVGKSKDGLGKQESTGSLSYHSTRNRNSASSRAEVLALSEYVRDHISNELHSCPQVCAARSPPSLASSVESPGTNCSRVVSDQAKLDHISPSSCQKKCLRSVGGPSIHEESIRRPFVVRSRTERSERRGNLVRGSSGRSLCGSAESR